MISVIIVTYNNQDQIRDCLISIKKRFNNSNYEVIIVDNLSKDQTTDIIIKEYPWVKLIKSKKNLGFGKGNNLGAKYAQGDILFFLNPDTVVKNNLIEIINKFFNSHPQAGAMSPRQLDEQGHNRYENIAVDPTLINLIRGILPRKWDWDKEQEIDLACAAAIAIKKDVFIKVSGFDPDFFLYMEENDLCLRIRQQGYKIFYHPLGKIFHLKGASISQDPERKKLYYKSQDLFYKKHYPWLLG
ncbi:unnamed protein product, partial [marine sediment metagenome]